MIVEQALLGCRNLLLRILGEGFKNPPALAIKLEDVGVEFPVGEIMRQYCDGGILIIKNIELP